LLLNKPSDDPEARTLLHEIEEAGERAAALTRQLLAFSRKQAIELIPLNLNQVVVNLVNMLRRLITENVRLTTDLCSPLCHVKADPGLIEQVVVNLVVNARDAMPRGGDLRVETKPVVVRQPCRPEEVGIPPGPYVTLVVRDTGYGMDDEVLAHLFEPFFTTKPPGRGTGLGLATVYGIVKQCGGHIRVASRKGEGSRFRIYFPLLEGPVPEAKAAPREARSTTGPATVLIVEDEAALRRLASQALQADGLTILEAGHGREALAVAERHNGTIDLVLSDVIMPFLNGPQLVRQLRPRYPGLKVVYMSGYTDSYLSFDGDQDSDAVMLHKPFTLSSLVETIRKALG
jgi:CheY-like chemotaxis protein